MQASFYRAALRQTARPPRRDGHVGSVRAAIVGAAPGVLSKAGMRPRSPIIQIKEALEGRVQTVDGRLCTPITRDYDISEERRCVHIATK